MTRPTITIVTPVHPGRIRNKMLLTAMHSVGDQTLLPDAIAIAIDNDQEGACATRQRALDTVHTDYVAFLDSDDILLPIHLEHCLRHLQDTDADFVYSWFKIVLEDGYGARIREHDAKGDGVFPPGHFLNPFDPEDPIETTVTTFVKTELAKEVGFQELNRGEANTGEDRFFTLGCLKAGANIQHLVEVTWLWRHHAGNTSGRPNKGDAA